MDIIPYFGGTLAEISLILSNHNLSKHNIDERIKTQANFFWDDEWLNCVFLFAVESFSHFSRTAVLCFFTTDLL